jgi:hypothetical protein
MTGNGFNLGFKQESMLYKMMKFGTDGFSTGSKGCVIQEQYISAGIETTESVLLAMPYDLKMLAIVVYVMSDHSRDSQARILSKRLSIAVSRRKMAEMLNNLHHRYEAHTSAINNHAKKDFNFLKKNLECVPPKMV